MKKNYKRSITLWKRWIFPVVLIQILIWGLKTHWMFNEHQMEIGLNVIYSSLLLLPLSIWVLVIGINYFKSLLFLLSVVIVSFIIGGYIFSIAMLLLLATSFFLIYIFISIKFWIKDGGIKRAIKKIVNFYLAYDQD